MPRQLVDRGLPLEGIQTAVRDNRVPYVYPRALQNVSLRDKRIRRRSGMEVFSSRQIRGQQLTKHSANSLHGVEDTPNREAHFNFFRSPLSYGLLRWNEDYQLRKTKTILVEFILTLGEREELVTNPFVRTSRSTYGGSGQIEIRGSEGVYVYDQTVLANDINVRIDGTNYNVQPDGVGSYADVFPLTTLAVAYNETSITVKYDLWNTTHSAYELGNELVFTGLSYSSGASYHISILQDTDTLSLYVDGELQATATLAADQYYVGEFDGTNGQSVALQRDIVLLNECTARAGYQSTCNPVKNVSSLASDHGYVTYNSEVDNTEQRVEPWACSPPAGTGITELRFWAPAGLTSAEEIIGSFQHQRLVLTDLDALAPPASYFPLNSGTGYCRDSINEWRAVTVHHTTAPLIDDSGLVHGKGLHFADGQHLIQSFKPNDGENLISPVHSVLTRMFSPAISTVSDGILSSGEFTFEMQIRTPYTYGQEITTQSGAITLTGAASDSREGLEYAKNFGILHGGTVYSSAWVRNEAGTAVTTNQMRWHRAFDQTLFSVEAEGRPDTAATNNWFSGQAKRVALTRGLLTPAGKVAFEVFIYNTGAFVQEIRVVSATALAADSVHTIGFRRRMLYFYDAALTRKRIYGFSLDIFIDGVLDNSVTLGDGSAGAPSTDITLAGLSSHLSIGEGVADVIIGASYVNHGFDSSMTTPNSDSATALHWPVTQRFMAPRQDQVGFFTLGLFRLWQRALSAAELAANSSKSLPSGNSGLVYALEIENAVGDEFYDRGPFSTKWISDYKGWGYPQANSVLGVGSLLSGLQTGWFLEDCLGYDQVGQAFDPATVFQSKGDDVPCSGLAFYSPTLSSTFGLLSAFSGFAQFDVNALGNFVSIKSPGYGLLSNYTVNGRWQGLNIGDRTVLTSPSGYPKVFNGTHILPLGFRRYHGGRVLAQYSVGTGSLQALSYYGFRIVYFAESSNTYHMSEQFVLYLPNPTNTISITNIPQHPDPRVTSIIIGMTAPQVSADLAASAPLYAQPDFIPNKMIENLTITDLSTDSVIDTNFTVPPHGTTAASYNGRLFIAGDPNIPDIIYFSDPGNPESFDTLTNRFVLEEGSGDRIVALKAMFGALYAFKANSIWRIDEVALGQFQLTRVAAIGPASEQSLEIITIPDSGRTAVIFWSGHGPYLFDEINLQYLGFATEQEDNGFNYVKHDTVFTVHDVQNRQVLFFYQAPNTSNRYIAALVYNYRHGIWTTDTGRPGYTGLSVDLTKRAFGSTLDADRYTLDYLGLVGADNGMIYKLSNETTLDGYNYDDQYTFGVTSWYSGNNTLEINWGILDPPAADSLNGLWLTLATTDRKQWVQVPLLRNQDSTLYLDLTDITLPFTPGEGCWVYFGLSPLVAEFPWDQLDVPYFDKQIQRVSFWATNNFNYAFKHSWRDADPLVWKDVTANGSRVHIESPAKTGEAFKLFIQTLESPFRFDSYAYVVEYTQDGAFRQ